VQLEFARPVRTSLGDFTGRESVIFTLVDGAGRSGYGEAAPWPGFGTESIEDACAALEDAARMLRGADVEAGDWPVDVALRLRKASAARAAVQGALWDLAARVHGEPLARYLARTVLPGETEPLAEVASHVLLVEQAPAALREEAEAARRAGFQAAKLKLGAGSIEEDVARARAAREGLGAGLRLRGDANGGWTESSAAAALMELAQFDFEFIEQPLPANDLGALAALRRRSRVCIALDESVATEEGALRAVATGAAQVVVLKPATLGGPARALEIAAMARTAGAGVVFTHALESTIGARHVLHCAAAFGLRDGVHGLRTDGLFALDVAEPVCCQRGWVTLPDRPGLGVDL
jgi:o-succinylbenzoate synthase